MNQPQNTFSVVSTHSYERMKINVDSLDVELTEEERDYIANDLK